MNILVLTQHAGHSQHNSMYGLARALKAHKAIDKVFVASRSDSRNSAFFAGKSPETLFAINIDEQFSFPADALFDRQASPVDFAEIDVFFLRIPFPVTEAFFSFLLESFPDKQFVNHPTGILKSGSKGFLLELDPRYTVPMSLCKSWDDIRDFASKQDCVLKPLYSYGGKGILRIRKDEITFEDNHYDWNSFHQWYEKENKPHFLAMQYLKNIARGDKRLVVAGGEILSTSLRKPPEGGWLANVAQGGSSRMARPDAREREMIEYLTPILKAKGIFYYGLDTLVNDQGKRIISEINTLSIGGISPAEKHSGKPLSTRFAELFVQHVTT